MAEGAAPASGLTADPIRIVYVPGSHLDLYWLGSYASCLARGSEIIEGYLRRCLEHPDETFVIETTLFAEEFLHRHPEHRADLLRLLRDGRVEIGAGYVDVWENLVLGESHVRNLQTGRQWLQRDLGYRPRTAIHPDLPGLNAQTPQLCRQSGIEFYATARKIFPEGRVWRAVGPDGSALLVLRWPGHYNFIPLQLSDLPAELPRWGDWQLDLTGLGDRFPLGTVPVSATVGDLTTVDDFATTYGRPLSEYVATYRRRHPEIEFGFSTPSTVLAPYAGSDVPLAQTRQPIPSVWGVAADESADFFRRGRRAESLLLAAETAAVLAISAGRTPWPESAAAWKGTFHEDAPFARKDPIPPGDELPGLWRMHLFTQDHNGGGQEGALSSYHKRIRQDRVSAYSRQILARSIGGVDPAGTAGSVGSGGADGSGAESLVAFNPTLHRGPGVRRFAAAGPVGAVLAQWHDGGEHPTAVQPMVDALGGELLAAALPPVPTVGVRLLRPDDLPPSRGPANLREDVGSIVVSTPQLRVRVETATGRILELADLLRGTEFAASLGLLRAVPEIGTDVTLRIDESAPVTARTVGVEVAAHGPLGTQIRIVQELLDVRWTQLLTVWADAPRVDLEVGVRWPGTAGWQLRLGLARPDEAGQVTYGSPFHATGWSDVADGASPRHHDEIDPSDYPRYREVQHWTHIAARGGGLTVTGDAVGLHRHPDGTLAAVLMRTATSCGDEHFVWRNAGAQLWRFGLHLGESSWAAAGAPELGDRHWRGTDIAPATGPALASGSRLAADGDPVILSALHPDGAGHLIRLANVRPTAAVTTVTGPLLAGHATAVDLTGAPAGDTDRIGPQSLLVRLPPWRIQTIRVQPPA